MVNIQFKAFGINLNIRHVNGMTPFNLAVQSGKLVKVHEQIYVRVRLLDTLEYYLKMQPAE